MTYEYECGACSARFTRQQRITDAPIKVCVKCGKRRARRLASGGTGFLLKGGRWAASGYS